jgi:hypothetical protein
MHVREMTGEQESVAACHIVLLCFALDDPESLSKIATKWAPEINFRPRRLLIGTKRDLWNPTAPGAISQADIDETAENLPSCHIRRICYGVALCSAKYDHNLEAIRQLICSTSCLREGCSVA